MTRSLALRALRSASKPKTTRQTRTKPSAAAEVGSFASRHSQTPPFKTGHYNGILLDVDKLGDRTLKDKQKEFYLQFMEDLDTIYPNQRWDLVEIGEYGDYIDRFRGFSMETLMHEIKVHHSGDPKRWLIRVSVIGDQYLTLRPKDLCDHNMYHQWLNTI